MNNFKLIVCFIIGVFVPLINSSSIYYVFLNKEQHEDLKYKNILEIAGIKSAIEITGIMLALAGINNGKTETGINTNVSWIVGYPKEVCITILVSVFISICLFFIFSELYIYISKCISKRKAALLSLVWICCMLYTYIHSGFENIFISILFLFILICSVYYIQNINKNNIIELRSLAFISLSIF